MRRGTLVVVVLVWALTPAVANAAFPGQNGRIAFGLFGIYTMDADGSDVAQVTPGGAAIDTEPEWSPDGTQIVFTRESECSPPPCEYDVWVVNADGSGATRLTSSPDFEVAPSWSPDGQRILFQKAGSLWTMNPDGSAQSPLTSGTRKASWSPNGTKIAFSRNKEIYTINPDGTGLTKLTTVTSDQCDPIPDDTFHPDWSPDGQKIVYVVVRDLFGCPEDPMHAWALNIMNADGSGNTELVPADGSQLLYPSWAPDGTQIAFERDGSTYLIDAGGGPETLVDGTGWSPDWQSIPVRGYPRPKGTRPIHLSLVPAYASCSAPNRTHGPPLAESSCGPPTRSSTYLTVGTPDANGTPAKSFGYARIHGRAGNPATPADEANVMLHVHVTDVRLASDLSDYTGELQAVPRIRITDRLNTPSPGGRGAGTVTDLEFPFAVPCAPTPDNTVGATCAIRTSADALVPDAVQEKRRAIWALERFEVGDGGPQASPVNRPFLVSGLFIP